MFRKLVGPVGALMIVGVACGGGGGTETAAAGEGGEQSEMQDALLEYAECMRDNGIDMPDPEVGDNGMVRIEAGANPEDIERDEMQAADEACRDLMPKMEEPSEEEKAELEDAMLEFTECMRDNGIDMPDPQENGVIISGGQGDVAPAVDFDDPDFRNAHEECQDLLPGARGGGS